jgi:putative membrane protein
LRTIANVLIRLVAVLHGRILVREMFFWTGPDGLGARVAGMTEEQARASAQLAMNQGLYNGFLAAGLAWGLLAGPRGTPVKVFFLVCVVVAGIFGAFTVAPVNWVLLLGQALPGALALGSLWLSEGKRGVVPNQIACCQGAFFEAHAGSKGARFFSTP